MPIIPVRDEELVVGAVIQSSHHRGSPRKIKARGLRSCGDFMVDMVLLQSLTAPNHVEWIRVAWILEEASCMWQLVPEEK